MGGQPGDLYLTMGLLIFLIRFIVYALRPQTSEYIHMGRRKETDATFMMTFLLMEKIYT